MSVANLRATFGDLFLLGSFLFTNLCLELGEAAQENFNQLPTGLEESPAIETFTAEGHEAFLPCDITPPTGDVPLLVIFFKGSEPIYSIDSRDGTIVNAIHWSLPDIKARLISYKIRYPPYGLIIPKVTVKDAGDYHCRVDFGNSPTRNLRVMLRVIAPPSGINLIDEDGKTSENDVGPFPLGSTVTFTCLAEGGTPRPQVLWLKSGEIVDQIIEEVSGETTRNMLTLPNLTREHLGSQFTCQVSNSNLTTPLTKSLRIDMLFPPNKISIDMSSDSFQAGNEYKLVCKSSGSRPPANLTFWKDGRQMQSKSERVTSGEKNITRSVFVLIPTRIDNGSIVACRASNSFLPGTAIEESNKIFVNYPPNLLLRVGRNLNLFDIKEEDDVYFECKVDANPKVNFIEWYKDGVRLKPDADAGVVVSGQSLVLQGVDKYFSGKYYCRGSNRLGSTKSNYLNLVVKYRPTCTSGQREVYGGSNNEAVNVTCELEAEPPAEIMHWAFNTTSELIKLRSKATQGYSRKTIMSYVPKTHLDYGSLLCWGENKVGKQRVPCVFQVVPASPPEPVKNCTAWQNASAAGILIIACIPGWNGGLNQTFTLQMRRKTTGPIILEDDGQLIPVFTIPNLSPGKEFYFSIRSTNEQGDSSSSIFHHFTPIDIAEERLSADSSTAKKSSQELLDRKNSFLIALIGGIALAVLISSSIVIFVLKARGIGFCNKRRMMENAIMSKANSEEKELALQNPDVILITSDGAIDVGEKEVKLLSGDTSSSPFSEINRVMEKPKRDEIASQSHFTRREDKLVDIASLYGSFQAKNKNSQAKSYYLEHSDTQIENKGIVSPAVANVINTKEPPDEKAPAQGTLFHTEVVGDLSINCRKDDLSSPSCENKSLNSSDRLKEGSHRVTEENRENLNTLNSKKEYRMRRATLVKSFSGEKITEKNV